MDRTEIEKHAEARKDELTASLDEHVAKLFELGETSTFDFDIATDIHSELIDDTTVAGRERLRFWIDFYENLGASPQFLGINRNYINLVPGCYGFGKEAEYHAKRSWVTVAEDPRPEHVIFERDADGTPQVRINQRATVFVHGPGTNSREGVEVDSFLLFRGNAHDASFHDYERTEYFHEPSIFYFENAAQLSIGGADITSVPEVARRGHPGLSTYLPHSSEIHRYIRRQLQKHRQDTPELQASSTSD